MDKFSKVKVIKAKNLNYEWDSERSLYDVLISVKNNKPFWIHEHFSKKPLKKGDTINVSFKGFGVSKSEKNTKGLIVKNETASCVGKVVSAKSCEQNIDDIVNGSTKTTKETFYDMEVDCGDAYVYVPSAPLDFKPKVGDYVFVRIILDSND